MLPSHQPLVIAEQAATLEALHPGRIDLGVGRSLGFTSAVRSALRHSTADAERFEADLAELLSYLAGTGPAARGPRTGRLPDPR
jgi:alkanesulfonate monooxygenase SsuD/methylene tetrahydromethanopterin reductase-like flavin-dependent oxidoreductase (luciferase family)